MTNLPKTNTDWAVIYNLGMKVVNSGGWALWEKQRLHGILYGVVEPIVTVGVRCSRCMDLLFDNHFIFIFHLKAQNLVKRKSSIIA